MYAWTDIKLGDRIVRAGTEVSKNDLGVSDDEWNRLIRVRSIRKEKYPKVNLGVSPNQHKRALAARLLAEATVGNSDDDEAYVFVGAKEIGVPGINA